MPTNATVDYTLTFDGGSLGNPGKGYGSYELRTGEKSEVVRKEFGGNQTNNEAEYKTLIAALADLSARIRAADGTRKRSRSRCAATANSSFTRSRASGR